MQYLFIIKRTNDVFYEKSLVAHIIRLCLSMRIHYEVVIVESYMQEETIVKMKVAAADGEPMRIIVCGTLSTLHFTINGCADAKNIEIGYLPGDNVQDVFSTFDNMSSNLKWNVENLLYGSAVDMDLIKVNNRYCILAASIGIDARFSQIRSWISPYLLRLSQRTGFGSLLTTLIAWLAILTKNRDDEVKLIVNGYEELIEKYSLIVFANSQSYGNGFVCVPEAKNDDGQTDLYLIRRVSRWRSSVIAHHYQDGKLFQNGYMRRHNINVCRRIVKAELTFPHPVAVCLDSCIYVREAFVEIETIPAAIKFIVPDLSLGSTRITIDQLGKGSTDLP
jgi:diacylglycerol kinase family enzyme